MHSRSITAPTSLNRPSLVLATVLAGLVLGSALATPTPAAELIILGIAQDAGHPQIACAKSCCADTEGHLVSSIALVHDQKRWIFDATPDLPAQLRALDASNPIKLEGRDPGIAGIFLTHAHIGHYTGLIYLGRESLGTSSLPVYAMPRMAAFLRWNMPWNQLMRFENVELRELQDNLAVELADDLRITPWLVPHRDELSETVGYFIEGPNRSALFLPDIDKWSAWDRQLEAALAEVDLAFLDGTFFADGEIPGRAMEEIPHPFIVETMARLISAPAATRAKVHFIHLNHTNPALDINSEAHRTIKAGGMTVANQGDRFKL